MTRISRYLFRVSVSSFFVIMLCVIAFFSRSGSSWFGVRDAVPQSLISLPGGEKQASRRLDLSERECVAAFPGLTKDIEEAAGRGRFVLGRSDKEYKGLVQGRIRDGKLYILTTAPDTSPEILHQRTAILHQLHRAILTSPSPPHPKLPDTYFAFVVNDSPKNNSWAFARPNQKSTYNTWLMPHFGFWSWPSAHLGAMDDALERIGKKEGELPWDQKIDKVVWRGTPWFNPLGHPTLRQDLVKVAQGKDWADVQALSIGDNGSATNSLRIEDFCAYKYVVYTEGVTYSGRLPYHQACGSVLLTPPLTYLTSTAVLMRPILAGDLLGEFDNGKGKERPALNELRAKPPRSSLPTVTDWRIANAIYVAPDFSDLERVIQFLRSYPAIAQRIARNQRDTFAGGGYLSQAAEVCYWRALIQGWASVAVVDKEAWGEDLGTRFESWILKEVVDRK